MVFFFLVVLGLRCCTRAFSSCTEWGATLRCGARVSHHSGFSCCGAWALGTQASVVVVHRLSSCGSRALECRLSSCGLRAQLLHGMWDLPRPGLEPVSPALAGRFLTTVPTGKSLFLLSFFFFFFYLINYLFIFGCVGSSFLCKGFLQLWQAGATLHRGAQASHSHGLSRCRAQAPDAQSQQLWLTGLAAPRHVGSSWTGARTRVPCIGRQIPNHCATREAPYFYFQVKKTHKNPFPLIK